jgi:diacylglycerol kinase (ATP)
VVARTQPNFRIHLVAAAVVLVLGAGLGLSAVELSVLVLAVGVVLCTEALNTGLESLADAAVPEFHPLVKRAKDAAAAGVLLAVLGAVAVGLLLLVPRLVALIPGR